MNELLVILPAVPTKSGLIFTRDKPEVLALIGLFSFTLYKLLAVSAGL